MTVSKLLYCYNQNMSSLSTLQNKIMNHKRVKGLSLSGREKYLADIRSHTESRLPRFTNIVTDHVVREGGTLALQVAVKGKEKISCNIQPFLKNWFFFF